MAIAEPAALPASDDPRPTADTSEPARPPLTHGYWFLPALVTAIAGAWHLGTPALWADELATWGAVRLSWSALLRLSSHVDAVVAPYYAAMKVYTAVAGTSTVALRLPSLLAMAATAAAVAVLGARLRSRGAGLCAGVLFAVLPSTSRYAQEARPYAFSMLFAVLATLLLVSHLQRPRWLTGTGYALAVALVAAAHVLGLLLLVAHGLSAGRRWRQWIGWAAVAVVAVTPLLWWGYGQKGQVSWIPPAHLHVLLGAPDVLFVSASVGGALVAVALIGALTQGSLDRSGRAPMRVLVAWAIVPALALAALGQVAPLFYPRYLLFVVPAWALLAGLLLHQLGVVRGYAIVAVIALLGAPTQQAFRATDGHPTASAQAAAIITGNEQAGDAIAFRLAESAPWLGRDVVARYVPANRRPLDVFETAPPRDNGSLAATECPDLAACLVGVDPPRIWVLRHNAVLDPLSGLGAEKEQLLRTRYHETQIWQVKGLTLGLYSRN